MGEPGPKAGLASAVQIASETAGAALQEPARVDLFGEALRPRGPGRPKGAINKNTAEALELIELYQLSPLQFLFSVFADQRLSLERRITAATAALPYVHKKQPQEIDLGDGPLTLIIGSIGTAAEAQRGGDGALDITLEPVELADPETPTKSEG